MRILMDNRHPYREIPQHRSSIYHQLLCRNASQLPPYHVSEQAHREDELQARTWLITSDSHGSIRAGCRAEVEHLIFVDTAWTNECIEASQRSQLPSRRCDTIKVAIYSV